MWLEDPGFKEWFKLKWNSYAVTGDPCFRFAKKLKMLKGDLKIWNKEIFGRLDLRMERLLQEVSMLDVKEGAGNLSSEEADRHTAMKAEVRRLLVCEEICWRQKSRVQWLKEGDKNTKFFHRMATAHKVINQIRKVIMEGVLLEDQAAIKEGMVDFYQ